MSRGWESKDVESQQQEHEERQRLAQQPRLTPEQTELKAKRDSLMLDRKRLQHDLETTRHPRRQAMLREALAHINSKLTELGG